MEKLTLSQFRKIMEEFVKTHSRNERLSGVIVFTEDSFDKPYTVEERSYRVDSGAKWFDPSKLGSSLPGNSLDGSDCGVRLDWYIGSGWKVEYCYLLDEGA